MRARNKGQIVYRHMAGLLRIVRGRLLLKAVPVAALGRSSITATFICDCSGPDDPPPLHDAHLVHADETRLILSGYRLHRLNSDCGAPLPSGLARPEGSPTGSEQAARPA